MLVPKKVVGNFARFQQAESTGRSWRVVQHGKTADAALLDEFLELTGMMAKYGQKKCRCR